MGHYMLQNTMAQTSTNLRSQIEQDSATLRQLIDLIPAHAYFDHEAKAKLSGKSREAELEGAKKRGENLSTKARWKRMRYDPSQIKTVTQMQEDLIQRQQIEEVMEDTDTEDPAAKKRKQEPMLGAVHLTTSIGTDGDIRQKLHAKLIAMKEKRLGESKSKVQESAKEKKLRQLEKKVKAKLNKKRQKESHKAASIKELHNSPKHDKTKSPTKPITNSQGKIVYSKFDFSQTETPDKKERMSGRNYKKLLQKVQKQKEKVAELKDRDTTVAQALQNKMSWSSALERAKGQKVKDNPELLKRSLKRQEKRKEKSQKAWKQREDNLQQRMNERQEKRKNNIMKKKQGRKEKKKQLQIKKGRVVPGF